MKTYVHTKPCMQMFVTVLLITETFLVCGEGIGGSVFGGI